MPRREIQIRENRDRYRASGESQKSEREKERETGKGDREKKKECYFQNVLLGTDFYPRLKHLRNIYFPRFFSSVYFTLHLVEFVPAFNKWLRHSPK